MSHQAFENARDSGIAALGGVITLNSDVRGAVTSVLALTSSVSAASTVRWARTRRRRSCVG
jgi:hypothetical protein